MAELESIAKNLADIFIKYLQYKKVSNINLKDSELSFFLLSDKVFLDIFENVQCTPDLKKDVLFVKKQISLLSLYIDREKTNLIKTYLNNVKNCDDFIAVLGKLFEIITEHFEIIGKSLNNTWEFFEELIVKINSIHKDTLSSMNEHVVNAQEDVESDSGMLEKIYGLNEQIEKAQDLVLLKTILMKSIDDLAECVKKNIIIKKERYDKYNKLYLKLKNDINDYEIKTKELKSSVEKYRIEAFTDYLTGLYNRKYMSIRLEEEQERFKRYGQTFVLLMLDIDNFKQINDKYGHIVGDYVLKYISDIIKANIREIDVAFRFGGEEFLILLPQTDLENSCNVADRLKETISKTIFKFKENKIKITVSQGLTQYKPGEDYMETIERADKLLLSAKEKGKNRVACE
jgi:diguanylate cyclase (GGDEF)-like protein